MFMDYTQCDTNHGWAGGECQQPGEQSLQLLYDSWWRVHKHRLQAGQRGELDALIRTRQCLQQQRQELEGRTNFSNADVWLRASELWLRTVSLFTEINMERLLWTHRW